VYFFSLDSGCWWLYIVSTQTLTYLLSSPTFPANYPLGVLFFIFLLDYHINRHLKKLIDPWWFGCKLTFISVFVYIFVSQLLEHKYEK